MEGLFWDHKSKKFYSYTEFMSRLETSDVLKGLYCEDIYEIVKTEQLINGLVRFHLRDKVSNKTIIITA